MTLNPSHKATAPREKHKAASQEPVPEAGSWRLLTVASNSPMVRQDNGITNWRHCRVL